MKKLRSILVLLLLLGEFRAEAQITVVKNHHPLSRIVVSDSGSESGHTAALLL